MALAPFDSWVRLWPTNISDRTDLESLIGLLNRRFHGLPAPPVMPNSASRSIWNDVSQNMALPDLIRLINRRLGGIRIPMNEDALIVTDPAVTDPIGSESILFAGQLDQTYHIGTGVNFQAGTHGNAWLPGPKRYCRRIQANGGGGGGYYRLNDQLDPRALIDPRYSANNWRLRARECAALITEAAPGVGTALQSNVFWGFGGMPNAFSTANAVFFPFVGFRIRYDLTAGGATTNAKVWRCTVVNDAITVIHETTTAIDATVPHELQIVFDSATSTVTWFVDGTQVDTYTFVTNTAPGQQTPYPGSGGGTAAGAWNLLYAHNNVGAGFITSFAYHMSPATPLITFEYDDT